MHKEMIRSLMQETKAAYWNRKLEHVSTQPHRHIDRSRASLLICLEKERNKLEIDADRRSLQLQGS
jgi:hypothetical protein